VKFDQRTSVGTLAIRSGDELFLPERGWVSRNGYVVGAIIGAAVLITTTVIVH
jgi:hypothetical protein